MDDDVFHLFKEAPVGQVWVCTACGKTSKDRGGNHAISRGWDESCMLNAVLCYEKKTDEGTWRAVPE